MSWPRSASRVDNSQASVSNPPYAAGTPRVPRIAIRIASTVPRRHNPKFAEANSPFGNTCAVRIAYLVHFRGGSETGIFHKVAGQADEWTRRGHVVGLFVATDFGAHHD